MVLLLVLSLLVQPLLAFSSSSDDSSSSSSVTPQITTLPFNETEPNNTRSQANLFDSAYFGRYSDSMTRKIYSLRGTISTAGSDVDYFKFTTLISGEFQSVGYWDGALAGQRLDHNLSVSLENASGTTIATSSLIDSYGDYYQSLHAQIPAGTYYLRVASSSSSSTYNGAAYNIDVYLSADCWVPSNVTPEGPTSGNILTPYAFTVDAGLSDCNAPLQIRFDWGDGTYSAWSFNTTHTKSWTQTGTYHVASQFRCSEHNFIVGNWSSIPLAITLSAPTLQLTVQTSDPSMGSVSGSTSQVIGTSVSASASPLSGYRFYRWQKGSEVVSRNNPYSFTLLDNLTLTGYFRDGIDTQRLFGASRYLTAVAISQDGWPKGAETVVLARGNNYADALAGVPLAYQEHAPILLTNSLSLSPETKTEITRLNAEKVIILGGTGAISGAVALELETMGLDVDRISGADRYETAVRVAERMRQNGSDFSSALLAVGTNFPDALAAASYAAMNSRPILLTSKNSVPKFTADAIDALGIQDIIIVGGTGVVSADVEAALAAICLPDRISGSNRYETSIALADRFLTGATEYCLANGFDFPDAITGAVLAARRGTGILLVQGTAASPPAAVQDYLVDEQVQSVTLFGGSAAITTAMENWF